VGKPRGPGGAVCEDELPVTANGVSRDSDGVGRGGRYIIKKVVGGEIARVVVSRGVTKCSPKTKRISVRGRATVRRAHSQGKIKGAPERTGVRTSRGLLMTGGPGV